MDKQINFKTVNADDYVDLIDNFEVYDIDKINLLSKENQDFAKIFKISKESIEQIMEELPQGIDLATLFKGSLKFLKEQDFLDSYSSFCVRFVKNDGNYGAIGKILQNAKKVSINNSIVLAQIGAEKMKEDIQWDKSLLAALRIVFNEGNTQTKNRLPKMPELIDQVDQNEVKELLDKWVNFTKVEYADGDGNIKIGFNFEKNPQCHPFKLTFFRFFGTYFLFSHWRIGIMNFQNDNETKLDLTFCNADGGISNEGVLIQIVKQSKSMIGQRFLIKAPTFYEPYILFEILEINKPLQFILTKVFIANLIMKDLDAQDRIMKKNQKVQFVSLVQRVQPRLAKYAQKFPETVGKALQFYVGDPGAVEEFLINNFKYNKGSIGSLLKIQGITGGVKAFDEFRGQLKGPSVRE